MGDLKVLLTAVYAIEATELKHKTQQLRTIMDDIKNEKLTGARFLIKKRIWNFDVSMTTITRSTIDEVIVAVKQAIAEINSTWKEAPEHLHVDCMMKPNPNSIYPNIDCTVKLIPAPGSGAPGAPVAIATVWTGATDRVPMAEVAHKQ